ncbi:hypothetical protein Hanom_Chr09g00822941 [Helianthus anomalus]
MCDASTRGGEETYSGRVGCSCCTGGRIPYTERRTVDGQDDYFYAFWRAPTSTSWRCTTAITIFVAAYCILVLLVYI